jgi:hypothetical protein
MHEGAVTEVYEDYSMVDGIFYLPNTILPKVEFAFPYVRQQFKA